MAKILLGLTSSIAIVKAYDLVRMLESVHELRIICTADALKLCPRISLQAFCKAPIYTELFDETAPQGMAHIDLAKWAECILIAPASAHCIAKYAHGLGDDLLHATLLATDAPVYLAPAMNTVMWEHPALPANLNLLRERGVSIIEPDSGVLACGDKGMGKMANLETICQAVTRQKRGTVLINAGGTRSYIDPVRFLTNASSGKMAAAMAEAFYAQGFDICYVHGLEAKRPRIPHEAIAIETNDEMLAALIESAKIADLFIAVAAICDYEPPAILPQKHKKQGLWELQLHKCPDILATVKEKYPHLFCVGFAAETDALIAHATEKLASKNIDAIVANPVSLTEGFGKDANAATLIFRNGEQHVFSKQLKPHLAQSLIPLILEKWHAQHSHENTRPTDRQKHSLT